MMGEYNNSKWKVYPIEEVFLFRRQANIGVVTTTHELQCHDAETKDIGFFCKLASHCILRCHVAPA